MIRENRQIQHKNIALIQGISEERVGPCYQPPWILKICAQWVPQELADEMRAERVRVSRELLDHFEEEGREFVQQIVTVDETCPSL